MKTSIKVNDYYVINTTMATTTTRPEGARSSNAEERAAKIARIRELYFGAPRRARKGRPA